CRRPHTLLAGLDTSPETAGRGPQRLRPSAAEQPGRDRLRPRTELRARRFVGRAVLWGKRSDSACTVRADGDSALFARKLRPMPDQEALHAGELIVLFGQDANGELFVRVLPKQNDEFTCMECFLVRHRSQLASEEGGVPICTDCAG